MKKKITKKTRINEVLIQNPKAAEILFEAGLMCIGCPMAMQETIEQGCLAHGIKNTKIEEIIKELNENE